MPCRIVRVRDVPRASSVQYVPPSDNYMCTRKGGPRFGPWGRTWGAGAGDFLLTTQK